MASDSVQQPGRREPPGGSTIPGAALLLCLVVVAPAAVAESSLDDPATRPSTAERASMTEAICELPAAESVCACEKSGPRSTRIVRLREGSFSGEGARERLAAVDGCGRRGTALLAPDSEGRWRAMTFYPRTDTKTCLPFDRTEGPDLLVCHRTVSAETWRVGWLYSLDFAGGRLRRREITSYRSNARGCPAERLRTTHPVEWHKWQVEGDPRPPLLTLRLRHRNGDVPDRFRDACRAMEEGIPVFGPRRVRTEYYALVDGRFEFRGALRSSSGPPGPGLQKGEGPVAAEASDGRAQTEETSAETDRDSARWTDDRRLESPVCRREDALRNVRESRDALADCYRRAFRASSGLAGTVKLRWRVGPAGRIEATEVLSDGPGDEGLLACVRSVVRNFEFPPPRGGERCSFVYPFEFTPESAGETDSADPSSLDSEESP